MIRVIGLTTALCSVGFAHPALAQDAPRNGAAQQDTDTGAGIEDIVVTATRRDQRLQQVPVAVTALTANSLGGAGINGARDLTQVVPGFLGVRSNSLNQPVIRGVGSSGISVGDESNVATYVDGIYQGDQIATTLEFAEIERVEVLRGPQGTVFGRNATGGLVNVITPDPSFDFGGSLKARYGRLRNNANDYDVRGYVNVPLSAEAAANLSLLYKHNDAYENNLFTGGKTGNASFFSARGKLLFMLADITQIIVGGEYSKLDSAESAIQPFKGNTVALSVPGGIVASKPWTYAGNFEPIINYEKFSVFLKTKTDIGSLKLDTTSAYVHSDVLQTADSDASNIFVLQSRANFYSRSFSQEVKIASQPGRFEWLAGAYYFHLDASSPINLIRPASTTVLSPDLTTKSYSGFGEATLEIVPRIFVTAGGRYTNETRSFTQTVNGTQLPFRKQIKKFDNFSYRGIVRYQFSDRSNIYASYSTAFKSGVFNGTGTSPTAVDPETIKATEVGLKTDPTPWLRANLAAYHYSYSNLQLTSRASDGTFVLQNAASATIYGGELELSIVASRDLSFRASTAYTHARFDTFLGAQVYIPAPTGGNTIEARDVSGMPIPRAPTSTVNLGVDWGHDYAFGRVGFNGNAFHSSKISYDNLGLFVQKAYTLINAEIYLMPTPDIRLSLWATNLTNAAVVSQITPGGTSTYALYQKPRRIGISADLTF